MTDKKYGAWGICDPGPSEEQQERIAKAWGRKKPSKKKTLKKKIDNGNVFSEPPVINFTTHTNDVNYDQIIKLVNENFDKMYQKGIP